MSSTSKRYSPEVRERAVRLVFDHQHEHVSQWSAIVSVAGKIGCTPETLRSWVRRVEVDGGRHRPWSPLRPGSWFGIAFEHQVTGSPYSNEMPRAESACDRRLRELSGLRGFGF